MSLEKFFELLEGINDLAVAEERRDEETIPYEEVVEELRREGLLED